MVVITVCVYSYLVQIQKCGLIYTCTEYAYIHTHTYAHARTHMPATYPTTDGLP